MGLPMEENFSSYSVITLPSTIFSSLCKSSDTFSNEYQYLLNDSKADANNILLSVFKIMCLFFLNILS